MKTVKEMALEVQLNAARLYLSCDRQCSDCPMDKGTGESCWPKASYETLKESRDPAVVIALRDGMSLKEASSFLNEVREEIEEAIAEGDFSGAEEHWINCTGLEPDYLESIL